MSNSVYSTPIIPISEIVAALKDSEIMKVSVTEADFQRPDAKKWMEVYLCIYKAMTSRSLEDASQLFSQYGTIRVKHVELHEEAMTQVGFALCMQRLLCSCGFPNFSVHDVIMPTRKRLIRIMSSFVNKMRHDIALMEAYDTIKDRCEQSKEECDKVMNLNKELSQQWKQMMGSEEQRERRILECTEESEKLMSQIAGLRRHREVENRILEEMKMNISEKAALKEKLKIEKNDLHQEHDKLSQKIVHSPDRFKQDQERLKKKVLELKELNDVKLNKLTTEKAITEQTANNRVASEKAVRLAKEVMVDLEKANELLAEMDQCNENLRELQEHLTAIYTECDDVTENIAIRQGQKHKLSHQLGLKKQCTQQQMEDVKRNHEIYQEKLDGIRLHEEQIKRNISECRQKLFSLDTDCENATKEWHQELSGIYQELDILHNNIANGCKHFKAVYSVQALQDFERTY